MSYVEIVRTAFMFFPVIAFLITLPFILHQYHKYGAISWFRALIIYSFILYLLVIYFLVILPLPSIDDVMKMTGPRTQLIPFNFVSDFIRETPFILTKPSTYVKALIDPSFYTVAFNIFMFVPFGMYLRYYFKKDIRGVIKWGFLLSLFFELTQLSGLYFIYPRNYRLFDVDDLLMNTLGSVIGFYIMGLFKRVLPSRDAIDNRTREKAKIVSGFRRFMIFDVDMFIFGCIWMFIYIFFTKSLYFLLIFYVIYYVLIPSIWNGKTLGSKFLNVRISFRCNGLVGHLGHSVMQILYNFILPLTVSYFLVEFICGFANSAYVKVVVIGMVLLGIMVFYIGNFMYLLIKGQMVYDGILGTRFESLIGDKESEKNT